MDYGRKLFLLVVVVLFLTSAACSKKEEEMEGTAEQDLPSLSARRPLSFFRSSPGLT